ncbi:MAG: sigma-70 family RNA polymerase sigma factor [Pirellulales bacterium]|nr:sigma-70 family RNA polymerase sigma factor [Pirellulales bacterium]
MLVRKFDDYDDSQSFVAWALGVARLEVLKHRRKHATDKHIFSDEVVEKVEAAYVRLAEDDTDRRRALKSCLEESEPRDRELLRLRYSEDLTPAEIAPHWDMTPGALRVLLYRVSCSWAVLQEVPSTQAVPSAHFLNHLRP